MVAFLALPLAGRAPDSWKFAFQVGLNTPTAAWADQARKGVQVNFTSAFQVDPFMGLGVDVQVGQGNAVHPGADGTGQFNTFAVLPEMFLSIGEIKHGPRFHAVAGLGLARVSEDQGWRTDIQPTREGDLVNYSYGGKAVWSTVRPVYQVGLGMTFPMKGTKRTIVELRFQRIQTPGIVLNSLPLTLGMVW